MNACPVCALRATIRRSGTVSQACAPVGSLSGAGKPSTISILPAQNLPRPSECARCASELPHLAVAVIVNPYPRICGLISAGFTSGRAVARFVLLDVGVPIALEVLDLCRVESEVTQGKLESARCADVRCVLLALLLALLGTV